MFPLSGALWWGFEWVNEVVQNWHYERPYDIPEWNWLQANPALISWVFFSAVIPAIWETSAWIKGASFIKNLKGWPQLDIPDWIVPVMIAVGVVSFALPMIWPMYFFTLVWGFLFFVLDAINYRRGMPSILGAIASGNWRTPGLA